MFALTPEDLSGRIVDCAAGPASFNAELSAQGHDVTSCDPLYNLAPHEIRSRIDTTYDAVVANARTARDEFVWRDFTSPEHLGEVRLAVMQRFLADFPEGLETGRYRNESLPYLDFREGEFDLALCSHFLFTYAERLSVDFHVAAIEEMCRVAAKTRAFPLLKAYGGPSPHLGPVVGTLRDLGHHVEVRKVPYEFQRGGDEMLAVRMTGRTRVG